MIKRSSYLKSEWGTLLGLGLFALCMSYVFFSVLTEYAALVSADSGPFYNQAHGTTVLEGLLNGGGFTPQLLYWLVLPPLYVHDLTYVIDSLVLALAGVYYLRGCRIHPLAAWFGGLALGLSGYTFTLFSAGHRGYFHMFSCAVWAFGLLLRCFETRRLFYFAMLGLVFAWGSTYQPDVLVLVGGLAGAYAMWLTVRSRRANEGFWKTSVSVWPRFVISVLVLALVGYGGIRTALTTHIAGRDAQIAGVSVEALKNKPAPAARTEADKRQRWFFATNWSLPPEDMLEFVVPGVFGDESMQKPYPYWGRLGRPSDEVFQKGRMMPNYRQHTVYLGVVSVLFAIFGVMAWIVRKRETPHAARPPIPDSRFPVPDHADVPFWMAVWVICLLLAMGRYTPFYRLFFSIPYMDYIRAPVKFLHLVEIATALLAGFGLDRFIRSDHAGERRRLVWLSGGLAGLLLIVMLAMMIAKPWAIRHISELGLGPVARGLGDYAVHNLIRSVGFAVAVAAAVWLVSRKAGRQATWAACAILILAVVDQSMVARRYVRVLDMKPFYHANSVVRTIQKIQDGPYVGMVNYATANAFTEDWFSAALAVGGIQNRAPAPGEQETPQGKLFVALQRDPLRLWQVFRVNYVVATRRMCEPFLRSGVLTPVFDFDLGPGFVRQVQPHEKSLLLARLPNAPSGPRLLTRWTGGIPVDEQIAALAGGTNTVTDAPASPDSMSSDAGTLRVAAVRGVGGSLSTRIQVSARVGSLLVFAERLADGHEVLLDGKRVTRYVVDALWPAMLIPPGEHTVVLRHKRAYASPLVSGATALTILAWWIVVRCAPLRPKRDTGNPA
ncbi:MAG: hypothetical protein FJ222_00455 [Lentisphaerae bacterium]|nr:hypothetical protein [Lentisphaerota bacterium]